MPSVHIYHHHGARRIDSRHTGLTEHRDEPLQQPGISEFADLAQPIFDANFMNQDTSTA